MAAAAEIDLKRLLGRLQASLSGEAHAAVSEEEALRRWTFVEHARELLASEELQALTRGEGEGEDVRRIALYENKLKFISDIMLASEGLRPALMNSLLPIPQIIQTQNEAEAELQEFRTQVRNKEESFTREQLIPQEAQRNSKQVGGERIIPSEQELRRQLGLGRKPTAANRVIGGGNEDIIAQLEREGKERESVTNDILNLLSNIRDNSLTVQNSLEKDHHRLGGLSHSLEQNAGNLAQEMNRMSQLYFATSSSCRTNCVMILLALGIAFASFLVLKLTPRPS